jgi:hypothetical protein
MRDQVTVPVSATNWLDDNGYYEYIPSQGSEVHKYPYDPKYLAAVIPDPEIVTETLKEPNAHIAGNEVLNGRFALVIEVPGQTVSARGTALATTTKYWIDTKTNQLLQIESVTTIAGGLQQGPTERTVNKLVLDELKDRSEFPADFFTFMLPPGGVLDNP